MKRLTLSIAVLLGLALAVPAFGGGLNLSGPHFNMNIIGVENPKTQLKLDGHTIFVALNNQAGVPSNIWLTQGPTFDICDGNAFTQAYDCSGNPINGKTGAVFQLPCDTNNIITTGEGCTTGDSANYTIWVRALGKPNGSATMTLCATSPDGAFLCNSGNDVVSSNILTAHVKKTFTNVTSQLTVLHNVCFTDGAEGFICEDVNLFQEDFNGFVWEYQNTGLRLAQVRFYLVD
jgi:hypothetical protein